MIIVTGAAGFIGSCLIARLNAEGFNNIVAVDDFSAIRKLPNLTGKTTLLRIDRDIFPYWLAKNHLEVEFLFHIGARTDTTEFDENIFNKLNVAYSKQLWQICAANQIPMVYASSAATYGAGEHGYDDDEKKIHLLKPLNPYGKSKHDFDVWALQQAEKPFFWAGLKFFNVYGPNEYHKGRMASVVYHAFNQIREHGKLKLFRSHRPDYTDGGQMRDFVYVKDVVEVCMFLLYNRKRSGIFNLGSGKARTFLDLAHATFKAMDLPPNIEFIDTPEDIRDKYQYFTEANMQKLKSAGYNKPFYTLEQGIQDYVVNYLKPGRYY